MRKNVYFLFILFSLGCETVVDVDVPIEDPKVTLNCMFTADSVWQARLTLSQHALDNNPYTSISDAKVVVYDGDTPYDTLIDLGNGVYSSLHKRKPIIGKRYDIVAVAPGFEKVSAQSEAPGPMTVKNVELTSTQSANFDGFNSSIKITFDDPADSEDYYDFIIYLKHEYVHQITGETIKRYHPLYFHSDDSDVYEGVVFDDLPFNGKEVTITIKASMPTGNSTQGPKCYLHARKLSKDLYKFRTTSLLQYQFDGDPLAQPVHVYTNITNGYGIFGGYGETIVELKK